ncbi:type I-E CRISPR-associated protein Cas7/Cse4/CasC [uncultured Flavonifractor sp.]|uniref:type I-E CRISPR-associated protein Cas7/Cse4/CasC n=1 Tax=uncultured Flavonifractor sp. TaxID=1193534 RepID=UPI002619CC75|nr:type I-E CRISPR-associated protein Cas7/Cse4/CasC [uncultured Flavonifractor sp.]
MNNKAKLYVDVHVLQTVPPSCINRDDTGSPKTAVYGGVTRARVSSQAWKRAMRLMFRDLFTEEQVGLRTKRATELVAAQLKALGQEKDCEKQAVKALEAAGIKVNKASQTDALFFLSPIQARELARLASEGETDKQQYKNALKDYPSVDMALFGRMVASDPSLNYDAAAQVAHSISTHEVRNEYDYFTAVDDCAPEENMGAGHLGTVEFHSATLYRYATINVRELAQNLKGETAEAVEGFIKAFLLSMPTGKQNTFANRTVPDLAYITLRRDQPVNLAGAFECPVRIHGEGYVNRSIQALSRYAKRTYQSFTTAPEQAFCIGAIEEADSLAPSVGMQDMLDAVLGAVSDYCQMEEES